MFSDRIFQAALVISLVVHGVFFMRNPSWNIFEKKEKEENIEISYLKTPELVRKDVAPKIDKREPLFKIPENVTLEKRKVPDFIEQKDNKLTKIVDLNGLRKPNFLNPAAKRPDVIMVKKIITIPKPEVERTSDPAYMNYYQVVYEKIKRCAYQNYTGSQTGEVALKFIVSSNGNLRESQVVNKKSFASNYLQEVALRSLKDASPFPNFPQQLVDSELPFNVEISFEVD